jgi:hypothetical protein
VHFLFDNDFKVMFNKMYFLNLLFLKNFVIYSLYYVIFEILMAIF